MSLTVTINFIVLKTTDVADVIAGYNLTLSVYDDDTGTSTIFI